MPLNKFNCVPEERIKNLILLSEIETFTVFDNCTVVACKLPNGYVIVESSSSIDPSNYSKEIGREACMLKIERRLCELERYVGCNEFCKI